MSTPNFNNDVPAVPSSDFLAGTWQLGGGSIQAEGATDVSAYFPKRPDLAYSVGSVMARYSADPSAQSVGHWFTSAGGITSGVDFVIPSDGWFRNIAMNFNFQKDAGGGIIDRILIDGFETELSVAAPSPTLIAAPTTEINSDLAVFISQGNICGTSRTNPGVITYTTIPLNDGTHCIYGVEFATATGHFITGSGGDSPAKVIPSGFRSPSAIGYNFTSTSLNYDLTGDATFLEVAAPFDMTLDRLYVKHGGTQGANGSMVYTLYKNDAPTSLEVTVPANGILGVYSDLTNSVGISKGDRLFLAIKNNHTANATSFRSFSMRGIPAPNTGVFRQMISGCLTGGANAGALTYCIPFLRQNKAAGNNYYQEGEIAWPATGVIRNLYCFGAAPAGHITTVTLWKNGSPTSLTVSFLSATPLWKSDITHGVAVSKGDLITLEYSFNTNGSNDLAAFSFEFAGE